jgi:hypothetical protein
LLFLKILLVLAVLFLLFCLLPLGVLISIDTPVYAWVKIGPLRFQVAPSRPKKKKPEKPKKEPAEKKQKAGILEKLKKIPKPTAQDLRSAYQMLWPPMKRAIGRTRRGVRIDPLQLSLVLAGKHDPAAAAEWYGYANAIVWTAMPVLEHLLVIPQPGIHIGVDYDAARTQVRGQVGLSIRIGTLLALGLDMAVPALQWFLQFRKAHRTDKKLQETASAPTGETSGTAA